MQPDIEFNLQLVPDFKNLALIMVDVIRFIMYEMNIFNAQHITLCTTLNNT